jgi:UrcA family protein
MKNQSLLLAFTAVVASYVGSANADTPRNTSADEVQSRKITFADLNLNSPEGITVLYRRITSAAERVCTPFESRELTFKSQWRNCMDDAISRAVSSINRPMLTVFANQHGGVHATSSVLAAKTK